MLNELDPATKKAALWTGIGAAAVVGGQIIKPKGYLQTAGIVTIAIASGFLLYNMWKQIQSASEVIDISPEDAMFDPDYFEPAK